MCSSVACRRTLQEGGGSCSNRTFQSRREPIIVLAAFYDKGESIVSLKQGSLNFSAPGATSTIKQQMGDREHNPNKKRENRGVTLIIYLILLYSVPI